MNLIPIIIHRPALFTGPDFDLGRFLFPDHPDYIPPLVCGTITVPDDATDHEIQEARETARREFIESGGFER